MDGNWITKIIMLCVVLYIKYWYQFAKYLLTIQHSTQLSVSTSSIYYFSDTLTYPHMSLIGFSCPIHYSECFHNCTIPKYNSQHFVLWHVVVDYTLASTFLFWGVRPLHHEPKTTEENTPVKIKIDSFAGLKHVHNFFTECVKGQVILLKW